MTFLLLNSNLFGILFWIDKISPVYVSSFSSHLQGTMLQRYVSLLLLAYCTSDSPEPSLLTQCGTLTSDATLVSLFRSNAAPLPCPIKGPLEFTYSQGEGECNSPRSRAEACTQDSRLLLRYQACANVHSSESVGQYSPRVIISCWHVTTSFYTQINRMSTNATYLTFFLFC